MTQVNGAQTPQVIQEEDPAEFYREHSFRGRRLIAWGTALLAIAYVIARLILPAADNIQPVFWGIAVFLVSGLPLYLTGYWLAVKGKGYHPVLFLVAFSCFLGVLPWLLGLLLILYLPSKVDRPEGTVN